MKTKDPLPARREKIKSAATILAAGAMLLAARLFAAQPFAYVTLPYAGLSYTDQVPATLDVAAMAKLALNGLTRTVDPTNGYQLYFLTTWNQNPPVLRHEAGSDDCLGKFIAPLVLNRIVSGSVFNLDVEGHILDQAYLSDPVNRIFPRNGASARVLEGFMLRYLRDENPMWKTMVQQSLQGWIESFYSPPGTNYGYWPNEGQPFTNGFWSQNPWKDEVLLLAYQLFGWQAAFDTAQKHIRYVKEHCGLFDPATGAFLGYHDSPGDGRVHFHMHALTLKTFLTCGVLANDRELVNFVQRSYAWAKSAQAGSSALLGFFPEFVNQAPNSEGCAISDMLDLALVMSTSMIGGEDDEELVGDYWDDADRWIRNHFAEAQLTPDKGAQLEAWSQTRPPAPVQPNESSDRTTERNLGAFAGWPGVNEWHVRDRGIQHCCTGNACRSIFHVWKNIVEERPNSLKVNLLLNRASRLADIHSYLPYTGRVDIRVKETCIVEVRIPGYVNLASVQCTIGGVAQSPSFFGRYLYLWPVEAGSTVTITFPNEETVAQETILGNTYTFVLRGHTVVDINPPGENCPLYARSHMRTNIAPMVSQSRFVSTEEGIFGKRETSAKLPILGVTASSDDGHVPANMLDGDQADESRWAANGDGQWAVFTLAGDYIVDYVNACIYRGDSRIQRLEVQVSFDQQTWTTVFNGQSSGVMRNLQAFDCADRPARYVRLVGHTNSLNSWNSFTEFEIWGVPARPADFRPVISTAFQAGTNLVFSGTNVTRTAGGAYYVLSSSDPTLPLANWTREATNHFLSSGKFAVTNSINWSAPMKFFVLQVP